MSTVAASAPAGQQRSVGLSILLFIVTLGFYGWYWAYKTQQELYRRTGEGIGEVLGLVIWILITPVSGFVIPSEIGRMYAKDGKTHPVTGWTGLWLFPGGILIVPAIVWLVKVQGALNRYWAAAAAPAAIVPPAAPPPPPAPAAPDVAAAEPESDRPPASAPAEGGETPPAT
jgi:hypothetical protein